MREHSRIDLLNREGWPGIPFPSRANIIVAKDGDNWVVVSKSFADIHHGINLDNGVLVPSAIWATVLVGGFKDILWGVGLLEGRYPFATNPPERTRVVQFDTDGVRIQTPDFPPLTWACVECYSVKWHKLGDRGIPSDHEVRRGTRRLL